VFSLEDEGFFYGLGYGRKYVANIPTGLHPDTLRDIKLGIFMNLEWHLESFEAIIPNCYSALGLLKRCSAFSNEDLPSDYLGFIANMKGWNSIGDVVNALGQDLESHGSNEMPAKNAGTLWDAFRCNYFGDCGDENPYNTCWTSFKVPSASGKFAYLPLPSNLIFTPIGPGDYWQEYDR
jgi:hypothetical protein